uniref:TAFII28-like protein domain-containing protein n=2 Tax=Ditylum brightwellii TaxID=49249 RepID=A0A7S4VWB0_9STRA|mmetsp:Transcript_4791/g.6330  ORF Transcript_4791/g.6330 Transcript_4791/m.6330 type:complete len:388 (+) Transcript_4791:219-1382(+)
MDRQRAIKRPRTNSNIPNSGETNPNIQPSTGGGGVNTNKPKTKKHKKDPKQKKGKKNDGSNKASGAGNNGGGVDGSLESTATKEGKNISQALSTFNTIEQSRFEAFRRCVLNASSISTFVAHCIQNHAHRRYDVRVGTQSLLSGDVGGNGACGVVHPTVIRKKKTKMDAKEEEWLHNALKQRPQFHVLSKEGETSAPKLHDLVAPNNAQEITAVVATLAKCYAQRLVSAARRVASSEQCPPKKKSNTNTEKEKNDEREEKGNDEKEKHGPYPDNEPILPHHLLTAYNYRVQGGVDPGFFLRPSHEFLMGSKRGVDLHQGSGDGTVGAAAAALGTSNKYQMRLDATYAAQDAYDEVMKQKKKRKRKDIGGDDEKKEEKEEIKDNAMVE